MTCESNSSSEQSVRSDACIESTKASAICNEVKKYPDSMTSALLANRDTYDTVA